MPTKSMSSMVTTRCRWVAFTRWPAQYSTIIGPMDSRRTIMVPSVMWHIIVIVAS